MLSEERKKVIENSAAQQVRESWGGLLGSRIREAMDDIRHQVIEEPWFGRATTQSLNSEVGYDADTGYLYGWCVDKAQSAWASLYGREPGQELGRDERSPLEQERDDPEPGR